MEDSMQSITTDRTELDKAVEKKQKTPEFYQAIGTIEGILEINDLNHILKVGEYSYPVQVRKKVLEKHQVGQVQNFRVYPHFKEERLFFFARDIVESPPSMSFILRGNWEIYNEEPRLIVYRNRRFQEIDQQIPILPLSWPDTPPADGRFWNIEAELKGDELVVIKAEEGSKAPPHSSQYKHQIVQSPEILAFLAAPPLTTERIQSMAASTKAQITFHLSQLPSYQERPDSRIRFFLNGGNGCIFSVLMKPEKFQQLVEHDFEQGVATLSGFMGQPTATGFYLIDTIVNPAEANLSSGEQPPKENATESRVGDGSSSIDSAIPKDEPENIVVNSGKYDRSTKQQSTQKQPTDQKILAVVAKADSTQKSETKGAKSKKKTDKATK